MEEKHNSGVNPAEEREEKSFADLLLSASSFRRLIGALFIVIGLLGFTDQGALGGFIAYAFAYVFGVFIYPGLVLLIILGLFLLIKGSWPKFRINFTGLGYFLVFIFGTLASSVDVKGLSLSDFAEKFSSAIGSITATQGLRLTSLSDVGKVGGGFVGYFFSALFLTGLGSIGTQIFTYLFLIIGAVLVLRMPFISVYSQLREASARHQAKKAQEKGSQPVSAPASEAPKSKPDGLNPFKESAYTGPKTQPAPAPSPAEEKKEEKKHSLFGIPREETHASPAADSVFSGPEKTSEEKESVPHTLSPFSERQPEPSAPAAPSPVAPSPEPTPAAPYSPFKETVQSPFKESPDPFATQAKPVPAPAPASIPVPSPAPSSPSRSPLDDILPPDPEETVKPTSEPAVETKREEKTLAPFTGHYEDQEKDLSSPFVEEKPIQHTFSAPGVEEREAQRQAEEQKAKDEAAAALAASGAVVNEPPVRYMLPSINLLTQRQDYGKFEQNQSSAEAKIPVINGVFQKLGIGAEVQSYTIGPSVTRFNIKREPGVRVSQISNPDVESEMKIDLKGDMSVRIEAVVRGQDTSGVEVGNIAPTMVSFRDCFAAVMKNPNDKLLVPIGEDISSEVICASLDDLPHLLIAGTTGSGKSVLVHSFIMTLIMRNYPDELKLILVDPKQVEFSRYAEMPHLYCPIVTNVVHAVSVLKKLVNEMERRYSILSKYECSKIQEYDKMREKDPSMENLPFIVCVIDEFADMMGQDPRNVDALTQRLAQKARAAGIYLIISTQRPSVKCITGTIKANIPARIALYLPSVVDSRTILDEGGAEALLGKGDLLARIPQLKTIIRLQSPFVSNDEISDVVHYLKSKAKPSYNQAFLNFTEEEGGGEGDEGFGEGDIRRSSGSEDELYSEIKAWVIANNVASTSSLQRHFQIGYGRAASILDALEEEGVIRTVNGNRKEVVRGDNTGEDPQ